MSSLLHQPIIVDGVRACVTEQRARPARGKLLMLSWKRMHESRVERILMAGRDAAVKTICGFFDRGTFSRCARGGNYHPRPLGSVGVSNRQMKLRRAGVAITQRDSERHYLRASCMRLIPCNYRDRRYSRAPRTHNTQPAQATQTSHRDLLPCKAYNDARGNNKNFDL